MRGLRFNLSEILANLRRSQMLAIVAASWAVLVLIYFLWELDEYRGLTAMIAEWQYESLGQNLPLLNLIILTALFVMPIYFIILFLEHRDKKVTDSDNAKLIELVVLSEQRLFRLFICLASVTLFVGLAALIRTTFLPTANGLARVISIGSDAIPQIPEGHVTLTGTTLYRRTATFQHDVLLLRRGIQFVPMVASGPESHDVRFFAELSPDRMPKVDVDVDVATFTGILRRNALPGAIIRLFRYAGMRVAEPHYVLYASRTSMCWPYYVVALNCLLAGCLMLALALIQRRRLTRTVARGVRLRA